ncbi:hypothetical protein RJ639_039320 [Escallonia herrerae]|uniref:Integrase catalytic domain-containing protein n=1 Tax=Escallonia herrerae TaxID=1293975 RepID=A0AA89BAR7_9ASTE|nr:hypothetical protein RJ639_039320 [Escallonia herrerae]
MASNTSTEYDLEKFYGSNDFSLWRMKMHVVLIQQGLSKALKDSISMEEVEVVINSQEKGIRTEENLISLGTLDSNGCSYQAASGVMRIMKGALVVMKGLKQNSLYLLQGSIVTGAAATTSCSDIDSNTTKLWHMRLGPMSEKGMDVLSKQEFCKNEGIVRHRTVRKMPQQNVVAEWINRTLLERARCMLSNVGLSKEFLTETINTAIHCKTPEEVWSGKHANYENLRIFGCPTYADVNDGKLEPRAKKCIFLGYVSGVKGYRLWCPDSKSSRFLISSDVNFDESLMLSKKEELIDVGKYHSAREKVELEVRAPDSLTKFVQIRKIVLKRE